MASTTIFILLLLAAVVLLLGAADNDKKVAKSGTTDKFKSFLDWPIKVTTIILVILAFLTFLGLGQN